MIATRTNRTHHSHNRLYASYNPQTQFNRGMTAQTGLIPEGTQLLQDTWPLRIIDSKQTMLEHAGAGVPVTKVTGIFQIGDEQNANGRVYPRTILREAVDAIQEDLSARSVWGEFDHPSDAKIHLDRISHLLTKIWMDGKQVYGEAEIMEDLPYGAQLATLLKRGSIGISSRGIGDMEVVESGGRQVSMVMEGYRFVTWDAVAEPSVRGAILHLVEGKLRPVGNTTVSETKKQFADKSTYEALLVEAVNHYFDHGSQNADVLPSLVKKLTASSGTVPFGTIWSSKEALMRQVGLTRQEADALWTSDAAERASGGIRINQHKLKMVANRPAPPSRMR